MNKKKQLASPDIRYKAYARRLWDFVVKYIEVSSVSISDWDMRARIAVTDYVKQHVSLIAENPLGLLEEVKKEIAKSVSDEAMIKLLVNKIGQLHLMVSVNALRPDKLVQYIERYLGKREDADITSSKIESVVSLIEYLKNIPTTSESTIIDLIKVTLKYIAMYAKDRYIPKSIDQQWNMTDIFDYKNHLIDSLFNTAIKKRNISLISSLFRYQDYKYAVDSHKARKGLLDAAIGGGFSYVSGCLTIKSETDDMVFQDNIVALQGLKIVTDGEGNITFKYKKSKYIKIPEASYVPIDMIYINILEEIWNAEKILDVSFIYQDIEKGRLLKKHAKKIIAKIENGIEIVNTKTSDRKIIHVFKDDLEQLKELVYGVKPPEAERSVERVATKKRRIRKKRKPTKKEAEPIRQEASLPQAVTETDLVRPEQRVVVHPVEADEVSEIEEESAHTQQDDSEVDSTSSEEDTEESPRQAVDFYVEQAKIAIESLNEIDTDTVITLQSLQKKLKECRKIIKFITGTTVILRPKPRSGHHLIWFKQGRTERKIEEVSLHGSKGGKRHNTLNTIIKTLKEEMQKIIDSAMITPDMFKC